jgi:hypothetical protein
MKKGEFLILDYKLEIPLSSISGFKKFASDFQKSWKTLLKIYISEQQKIDLKKISEIL